MNKNEVVVICHDDKAMTWDILRLKDMNDGLRYLDCIEEHCDYDRYSDIDIANLTQKIYNNYEKFKKTVNQIIEKEEYEIAHKMQGYCLIIEK